MTQSSSDRKARRYLQITNKLKRAPENSQGMPKGTPWTDSATKKKKYKR